MKKTIGLLLICSSIAASPLALASHVYSKTIPVTINNHTLPNDKIASNVYVYLVPNHTPAIEATRNHPVTKNMRWINCTYDGPYSECFLVFGVLNNNKKFFDPEPSVECTGTITQFKHVKSIIFNVVGSTKGEFGFSGYAPPLTCNPL